MNTPPDTSHGPIVQARDRGKSGPKPLSCTSNTTKGHQPALPRKQSCTTCSQKKSVRYLAIENNEKTDNQSKKYPDQRQLNRHNGRPMSR